MTFRFLMFSEEKENFVVEIIASPSTTFYEFHKLILKTCGYTEEENHVFLICNEDWKVKEKIYLHDSNNIGYDEDIFLMGNTTLDDFIEEEGQRLAYVYEKKSKKSLLIELVENIFGQQTERAYVNRQKGTPPRQHEEETEEYNIPTNNIPILQLANNTEVEETEEGALFSDDELDMDGFEVSEIQ